MKKYFIITNSHAAPFFSDADEYYVKGKDPKDAMEKAVKNYSHPCGLYAANLYLNADAYHQKKKPLVTWQCNKEIKKQEITKKMGCFSYLGISNNHFKINGIDYFVDDPNGGQITVLGDKE